MMIEPFVCHGCSMSRKSFEERCGHCGAERPRGGWAVHPHIGDLVADRYRILSALGRGSSGDVYLARDRRLHADAGEVVIKIFSSTLSPTVERRFQNEVRAARKIDNRHCVAVFDAGTHRGAPYLVMERVRGQTLRQWQKARGRPSADAVIELFDQVAEALLDVHAAGIVHRDLKPENLMVVREDPLFVKVLDFGVAHLADDGATFSGVGTPRYMAPEQALHEPVDARTDVYALGVCVYELLAGAPPFTGESVSELLRAKQDREAAPLVEVAPDVPAHVARLVDAMIRREPDARPHDMGEVLRRLRTPEAAAAPPAPSPPSPASPPRRHARVIAAAFVVVGVLVLVPVLGRSRSLAEQHGSGSDEAHGRDPLAAGAHTAAANVDGGAARALASAATGLAGVVGTEAVGDAAAAPSGATPSARRPSAEPARGRGAASSRAAPAPAVTFRSGGIKADEL